MYKCVYGGVVMKSKNKLLTLLTLSASAATTIAFINKCIKISSTSKNLLTEPQPLCFKWRLGNIYYTKSGTGRSLLLIHDLNFASSGYEWNQLIQKLKDYYTVYTIDLLGCGRSEKPDLIYTNYLYVQLISDFIKSEIGHRTNVIATGGSSSLVLMACNNSPELFEQLLFINPDTIMNCAQIPGKYAKIYKLILDMPIIGTLYYHFASSKQSLRDKFCKQYFYNPYLVKPNQIDYYYEASNLGKSPKSIFTSVLCNYTKCNIVNALKKVNNSIYIIGGGSLDHIEETINEYKFYNSSIETSIIENTKYLPHIESPSSVLKFIKMYLL